uniref:Uncharacterized protein n=1 Tax=Lotharella globosa TaxID=91324 RepID=A0A7S3Z9R6_9EUKA
MTNCLSDCGQLLLWSFDDHHLSMKSMSRMEDLSKITSRGCYVGLHFFNLPPGVSGVIGTQKLSRDFPLRLDGIRRPHHVRRFSNARCHRLAEIRIYVLLGNFSSPTASAMATAEACRLGQLLEASPPLLTVEKLFSSRLVGALNRLNISPPLRFTYPRRLALLGVALRGAEGQREIDYHSTSSTPSKPSEPAERNPQLDLRGVPHMSDVDTKIRKLAKFEHDCTKVAEGIYVAGESVARDLTLLESCRITHILNCTGDAIQNCFPDRFRYMTLYLCDAVTEDLESVIPAAISFIDDALNPGQSSRREQRVRRGSVSGIHDGATHNQKDNNVLVHCHQGVSRSCSLVIAYLIFKERKCYDDIYKRVKASRKVCRPNLKFTCDLLAFGKRVVSREIQECCYRVAYHARTKSPLVVCKKLGKSNKTLDRRGVYILFTKSKVMVWVGSACDVALKTAFLDCAAKFVHFMQRIQDANLDGFVEYVIQDKHGGEGFVRGFQVGQLRELDNDYQHVSPTTPKIESQFRTKETKSNQEEDIDEEGAEDDGEIQATLYEYPDLNSLPNFTTDDLFPDKAYVLYVIEYGERGEESARRLHVWIGEDFELPEECDDSVETFAKQAAENIRRKIPSIGRRFGLFVEREDEEGELFLDGFKEG